MGICLGSMAALGGVRRGSLPPRKEWDFSSKERGGAVRKRIRHLQDSHSQGQIPALAFR